MTSNITRQVFVIEDLLQGKSREVSVYSREFVLCPHYHSQNHGFLENVAYLGVVEDFGKFECPGQFHGNSFIKLNPFYKIYMLGDGNAKVEEWTNRNKLLPNFFKTIYTGPAEAIAQALREAPFSGMEQLAEVVKRLKIPYNLSLRDFFENGVRELIKIA